MLKTVQIISDLHLEFYKKIPTIPKLAETLFLVGDIGKLNHPNYVNFFDDVSKKWSQCFYVLGNHEYYINKDMELLADDYKEFFKQYANIKLLDRTCIEYDGYMIMGCTLWSNLSTEISGLNDFRQIKKAKSVNISLSDYQCLHKRDREWLLSNYNKDLPTIIMTHFPLISNEPPRFRLANPIYDEQPPNIKEYFYNTFSLTTDSKLVCISGHTHYSHDFVKEGVRYISNQVGYKLENDTGYKDISFDIDSIL